MVNNKTVYQINIKVGSRRRRSPLTTTGINVIMKGMIRSRPRAAIVHGLELESRPLRKKLLNKQEVSIIDNLPMDLSNQGNRSKPELEMVLKM